MFWFDFLGKFFKALVSGDTPAQVAAGFSFGWLIGLMPFFTLQSVVFALFLLLLNVNLAAGVFAFMLAGLIAFLFDPFFHQTGLWALTMPALQGFWTALNNMPVAPLTRFYNTVSMGSLLLGLLTVIPIYFGFKKFVIAFRERLLEKFKKLKIVQMIRGSSVYQWLQKIMRLGDA